MNYARLKNYKKDKNYNILDSLYIYHYILLPTNFYCILSTHKMSSKSVHEWDDLKRQARLFFVKIFSLTRVFRFSNQRNLAYCKGNRRNCLHVKRITKKDKNYNILDSLYIYHYILLLTNFYCILSTHKMSSKSVHEWDDLKRQARLFFVKIFSLTRVFRFSS